jgi:hypothetical protein
MQERVAYPEWTQFKKKNGLDPLGMQNGSINLYQRLLPGISNVTLRIRYYGLYAWLASVYARREGQTNIASWQRTIRRAEALYALIASHHQDDAGVAGSRWARRNRSGLTIRFADSSDLDEPAKGYLEQAWGAYGAAYGSQLLETGVLCPAADHDIPVPSAEFGDALAQAFADGTGKLADRYYDAIQRGDVTQEELEAFAPLLPSSIGRDSAERQLYVDLLFARGELQRPTDLNRRDTLLILLHAAAHLKRSPDVASARWLLYAASDEQGRPFTVGGEALRQQRERWWVYQANDLLHYGYETLLKFALDTLESYPGGISLATLIGASVAGMEEAAPSVPATWKEFVAATKPAANPADANDEHAEAHLVEVAGVGAGENEVCPAESAWAALKVIAVVWQRARERAEVIKAELGGLDREGFHSLVTEGAFLASLEDMSFSEALSRLIEQRVIKRHLWVAHRKFRHQGDYTFLVEADDGLVRLRATSGPVFTNPRMGSALGFLSDLHLIDDKGLTALGRRLVDAS